MHQPSTIPLPRRLTTEAGHPPLPLAEAVLSGPPEAVAEARRLLGALTGRLPELWRSPDDCDVASQRRSQDCDTIRAHIRLAIAPKGAAGAPESYRIGVADGVADVVGADAAGLFYGVQTLVQLAERTEAGWMLPAVEIEDAPRFAYRGAMLDVARHFFDVATVCAYIDRLASLKLNHLHLHLTDDQGWRIALASRPELTARASATAIGGDAGGSYSREDYAAIVAYAAARHVTVVPEVDVPGHTHAVGLAHPELVAAPVISDEVRATATEFGGGLPVADEPYTGLAVGFSSLRPRDSAVDAFLADVFGELASLTPGPYVHLGGDEALGTSREDYAALVRHAVDIVAATGKTPIAWHEAATLPDVAERVVSQFWGYVHSPSPDGPGAAALADPRARLILSPADAIYLDMKPDAESPLGLTWANGPTSVAEAYGWDPRDLAADDRVLGVEAPMWTETLRTLADLDAMAFPRLAAAAEIAWSPAPDAAADRTWESFRARVADRAPLWTALGIGFPRSAEIPWHDA